MDQCFYQVNQITAAKLVIVFREKDCPWLNVLPGKHNYDMATKWDIMVRLFATQYLPDKKSNNVATKSDIWVGDEDCLWLKVFTR